MRAFDKSQLPQFLALRAATYVGWINERMAEPGSAKRIERFIADARIVRQLFENKRTILRGDNHVQDHSGHRHLRHQG